MSLAIGDVVARSGVPHDTLRYWEREGLVPPPQRDAGGRRRYDESVLALLEVITALRECGFGVAQVRDVVAARLPDATATQRVAAARARLDRLAAALDEQEARLARARDLVAAWRQELDTVAAGDVRLDC